MLKMCDAEDWTDGCTAVVGLIHKGYVLVVVQCVRMCHSIVLFCFTVFRKLWTSCVGDSEVSTAIHSDSDDRMLSETMVYMCTCV